MIIWTPLCNNQWMITAAADDSSSKLMSTNAAGVLFLEYSDAIHINNYVCEQEDFRS
jgi:hypothetical protein